MSKQLKSKSTVELLQLHGAILETLRERKITRTLNSPTGDYAETLFQKAFGWRLENNSSAGHDATAKDGAKIQIKCRRLTRQNKSRQLGVIRNFEKNRFKFLAAILFGEDYSVRRAIIIPRRKLLRLRSRYSSYVNGQIFHLDDNAWNIPGAIDVTKRLQKAANRL